MPSATLTGLAGVAIAVASICVYHLTVVGPNFRRLRRILSGEAGPGDAAAADVRARGLEGAFAKRTEERLAELERIGAHDVYRVGFIRYNSFSDVGSDQSYALALVNQDGDGVVVSSIYSREETRTFGKAVRKFVPNQESSKEELQAIAMARTGIGT
jgi:uncharacterized protein DUF4446